MLKLAHDHLGHMSPKRVRSVILRKFTWPGVCKEYCCSCEACQRFSKERVPKAPLVTTPVRTVPFESLAFDIVGPFPKAKGGFRFLLTCICSASKWPKAIVLKSVTAKAVAQGMLEVFCRTGVLTVIDRPRT